MKLKSILIISIIILNFPCFSTQDPGRSLNGSNPSSVQNIPWMKNIGQYPDAVRFASFCPGGKMAIDETGNILYYLSDYEGNNFHFSEKFNIESVGTLYPEGKEEALTKVNILKGSTDTHFQNIPTFTSISYGELWPQISVKMVSSSENVEKIYSLSPGSNPADILISLDHIDDLCVDETGQLQVDHSKGSVFFSRPLAWQYMGCERTTIDISYKISNTNDEFSYGFNLGEYDKTSELLIDPILASTYLGGNSFETGNRLAMDDQGKIFIGGETYSEDLPVDLNAYDQLYNGSYDIYVAKFSNDLSVLEACTFLGGSDIDFIFDMDIDQNGHLAITGNTRSTDFPTSPGVYDNSYNGGAGSSITPSYGDIFITKLSNDLSMLEASTYIGGEYREWGTAILCDQNNDIYITGINYSELPKIGPQFYAEFKPAFIMKIDSDLKTLLATNYVDIGSLYSGPYEMIFDLYGNLLIVGTIGTLDELQTTPASYDPTFNEGSLDAFILKVSPDLSQNLAATYLGGSGKDYAYGICVDHLNNVYISGTTHSNPFPVTPDAYDIVHDCDLSTNNDAFVSKFDPMLSTLLASTYLGGTGSGEWWDSEDDSANELIYDPAGFVFVYGSTESSYFPLSCESIDEYEVKNDAFIAKLDDQLSNLHASTLLGGSEYETGIDILQTETGELIVCGSTYSEDFQVMNGDDLEYNEGGDAFVTKLTPDLIKYTPCCTYAEPYNGIWTDVDCSAKIIWEPALKATGYYLSAGSARDNFDIIEQLDLGNVLSYDLMYLPNADTVWLKIDAYNEYGIAYGNGCRVPGLITASPMYYFESKTMCQGDTFYWEGFPMTDDGVYEVLYYAANGCDSIIHLDLEVIPCFHESVRMDICEGDSVFWFGEYYYEPGTYYQYFDSKTLCDSTYQLILNACDDLSLYTAQEEQIKMIIYPNPFTKGDLMIETGFESELKVSIFDIQGKVVYKKHFQGPNFKFKGLELESGLYFVSLGTNKGDKRIKQLVVLE